MLVPGAVRNLLGWDLQLLLGIGVLPEEGQMRAKILTLTNEDKNKIEPEVWASENNRGKIDMKPIEISIEHPSHPIRVRQYAIPKEGRMGLK